MCRPAWLVRGAMWAGRVPKKGPGPPDSALTQAGQGRATWDWME